MLLRNIDPSKGHVNGLRYIVSEMTPNTLNLILATGAKARNKLCPPRMPCGPGDDSISVQKFLRTQFPVRVFFVITTNKAQGQSFGEALGILRDHLFSHVQLYVALSRVTHPKNIQILCPTFPMTRNVVYPEALQN